MFFILLDGALGLSTSERIAWSTGCGIRSVNDRSVSHCRKRSEEVKTIYFLYSPPSLSRLHEESFEDFFRTNPCYICSTGDDALPDVLSYIVLRPFATICMKRRYCASLCSTSTSNLEAVSHCSKQVMNAKLNNFCRCRASPIKARKAIHAYIV